MFENEKNKAFNILDELISISSPYFKEHEISERVYEIMQQIGSNPVKQLVVEKNIYNYQCNNVISFLNFNKKETIVINAHMDTVYQTKGWKYNPLKGTLVDDEVYGLGAADMKGGLTCLLITLEECINKIKKGKEPHYNVLFLASVDEEGPFSLGAKTFLRSEYSKKIDFSIILESSKGLTKDYVSFPTIAYGSKGSYLYEIEIIGQSGHAADPDSANNAINKASKVIDIIREIELKEHNEFTEPISNIIWINGGERALSTPERCKILIDFHITPNEKKDDLKNKIIKKIESLNLGVDFKVNYMEDDLGEPMIYKPYILNKNNKHVEILAQKCKELEGNVNYNTSICVGDFNHFADKDIPTVVLGPDGENLHKSNERVNLPQLIKLKDILVKYIFNE